MKTLILKTFGATILALSLVGCGSVSSIKQNQSDSDAKQLMKIVGVENDSFVLDGTSPETANVGVPDSLMQKYNNSNARHAVNYLAGGLSGVVSLGIIQGNSYAEYKHDYNRLNYPRVIIIANNYKDFSETYLNMFKAYEDFYPNKTVTLDKEARQHFIDGENCSYTERNCVLKESGYLHNLSYTPSSFPKSLSPSYVKENYQVGFLDIKAYHNYDFSTDRGVLMNEVENFRAAFNHHIENKVNLKTTAFFYIPAEYNNGVPVIIDESGKEHYFVKK